MTDSDLFNYAVKHYYNPACKTAEEFADDYNLTLRIKKLINRHLAGEDINFRLLLNNFMMFYNVFEPRAATVLLFAKLSTEHYPFIKTVATFLNYLPPDLKIIDVDLDSVTFNQELVDFLREI